MKSLSVYDVYIDDGMNCLKIIVPAESETEAKEYVKGNGEVVAIRKDPIVQDINTDRLALTLKNNGWGQVEISIIVRALEYVGLDRYSI